ncbi:MAG: hemolysin [Rhizobacter sp.]|nr:hemolysin [Rhizobacter sp.]
MRADQLLVSNGLAPTRSAAQRLLERGAVEWNGPKGWAVFRKAGVDLPEGSELRVVDDAEVRWVSRGGLKLEGALARAGLKVEGARCLDVGQSTGGFTDVLLAAGALQVVGVDVGHGQLSPKLAADDRVQSIEGLNARDLTREALAEAFPATGFDLIVADLSFISLAKVLKPWPSLLADHGRVLALVKPQFEVGKDGVGKGGLVKDERWYPKVEVALREACAGAGLSVLDYFESSIDGGDGNREFFLLARRA